MGRSGRPRKSGDRHACGRLKKQGGEAMSGALWQRLKTHGRKVGVDPRIVSELGRLNWFGELTLAQTAAGIRIAEVYGRYEGLKGLRRSCRSPSYERSYGGGSGREAHPDMLEAIEDATETFLELQGMIPAEVRSAVEGLCVEDRSVSPALYDEIRFTLDRFAKLWRLTGGMKKAQRSDTAPGKPMSDETPKTSRASIDRSFWVSVAQILRPDLSTDDLKAYFEEAKGRREEAQARADRERFRDDKAKGRRMGVR